MQVKEPIGGQLEILSKSDIDRIHGASMEVLRRLGIKVWSPVAFKLFEDAGAEVDKDSMMVKFTEEFVLDTVRKAPSEFAFYGRNPKYKLTMGGKRVHFALCGQGVKVQGLDGSVRLATVEDVGNMARLADHCEWIHHSSMMTSPMDVPPETMHIHALWANLKNSSKTTDGYNLGAKWAEETLGLAAIVRGGMENLVRKPMLLGFTNPVSPMQLSKDLVEGAIVYAKHNQPVLYAPEALAGGTAPATIAGLLVQQNAEVLSGIMVSQLAKAGSPVLYGTVSAVLDMRSGATALGGPEVGLINLATAQLARHYRLPCRGTGGNSDSKLVDAQAGIETALSLLHAAYAGMNFIYDSAGSLDGSITTSYEKIVVDNEVCGMVARILQGIKVSQDTLAVDEIVKAGPAAGYLSSPHTLKSFRSEHYLPTILDRRPRDAWEAAGGKDLAAVARERARSILLLHKPEPVEREVLREGDAFVKKVAKGYGC